ncbi:MAG TPA: helix-turn-helix domain-containing protein [Pseudomonadales bacterium]|nr:helix-turn-helix domain-containing protein [Pseudomonadales bacterium]
MMFENDFDWEDKEEEIVLVDSRGMTPRQANLLEIEAIAKAHCFTLEDILGPRKFKPLVAVRRKCVVMLREKGHTMTEIGRILRRDHTTIVHALQKSKAEA